MVQKPCEFCGRVAGHSHTITKGHLAGQPCPRYKYKENEGKTSRGKLYDAAAVLWCQNPQKTFVTFTLPSLEGKTYQREPDCPETGDSVITSKFSKVLEAWAVRVKRQGRRLSYVWTAEAQMKRQAKFGGAGDIHFHLCVNEKIKEGKKVVNVDLLNWVQDLWCSHVGTYANNCVHYEDIPDDINSIPAYLAKYLGKGTTRPILSRRYFATHDLSRFQKISMTGLPDATLITTKNVQTPDGYEVTMHYFNTREVLELYGDRMVPMSIEGDRIINPLGRLTGTRNGKGFTDQDIVKRAYRRQQKQLNLLQYETPF